MLRPDSVFADDIVAGLAELVGINEEGALHDHRDLHAPPTSRGRVLDLPEVLAALPDAATLGQGDHDTDPAAAALVQAATVGDVATLQRMAADTTDIDRPAPTPVPGLEALAGLAMTYPGAAPQLPMSPLLAAVTHRPIDAVAVLLEIGADANGSNEFYGTPVFAACGAGYPDILKLLLEHGGNPNARDARGQTPLQALQHGRRSLEAVAQIRSSLESLGLMVPPELDQLMTAVLPTERWDACEEILRQRDGKTQAERSWASSEEARSWIGMRVGLTFSLTTSSSMTTRAISVRDGNSYMVSRRTSSMMARRPRAPVPRLSACSAMAPIAPSVTTSSTPSISKNFVYWRMRALRGS